MIRGKTIVGVVLGVLSAVAVAISFMVFAARITCPESPQICLGTPSNDVMSGDSDDDGIGSIMDGGLGSDLFRQDPDDADQITGGPGNDRVVPFSKDALVTDVSDEEASLGDGNDRWIDDTAADMAVDAGDGNDIISFTSGSNHLVNGGEGNNRITTAGGNDAIIAGDGNNVIMTAGGDDNIETGSGNNRIQTGAGDDVVTTGDGDNIIDVAGGDDKVIAGAGNDVIRLTGIAAGTEQGDEIQAGDGDDIIFISGSSTGGTAPATTVVSCGDGEDVVRARNMSGISGVFTGPLTVNDAAANTYIFDADCETIFVR